MQKERKSFNCLFKHTVQQQSAAKNTPHTQSAQQQLEVNRPTLCAYI